MPIVLSPAVALVSVMLSVMLPAISAQQGAQLAAINVTFEFISFDAKETHAEDKLGHIMEMLCMQTGFVGSIETD